MQCESGESRINKKTAYRVLKQFPDRVINHVVVPSRARHMGISPKRKSTGSGEMKPRTRRKREAVFPHVMISISRLGAFRAPSRKS